MAYTQKPVFQQSKYQSNEMDSKSVFALRKEDKLQEAYQLAISLLDSNLRKNLCVLRSPIINLKYES